MSYDILNNGFKSEESEMAKQRDKGIKLDPQVEQIEMTSDLHASDPLPSDDARLLLNAGINAISERGNQYNNTNDKDGRERHMTAITQAFNAVTGHSLTVREGWLFMVLLKAARAVHTDDLDTYVDMAAYAALAGEQRNA